MYKLSMKEREELLNNTLEARNEKFRVKYIENWKNNSLVEGYVLETVDSKNNCCPTIYRDDKWFGKDDFEVANYLSSVHEKHSCSFDVKGILNQDYIRDNIYPRLVGMNNKEEVETRGLVNIDYLDMLILFYVRISVNPFAENKGFASIPVTREILSVADLDEDAAYELAVSNIEKQLTIRNMVDLLSDVSDIKDCLETPQMIICSNKDCINGAAVVLCDNLYIKLKGILNSDNIAIIPSSVEEVIALKYQTIEDLIIFKNMVEEVNRGVLTPEEILTDSVYIYTAAGLQIA